MTDRIRMPPDEALSIAIAWLQCNEGEDGGEQAACYAVARWIDHERLERIIRNEARRAGIPTARLRRAMADGGSGL